MFSKGKKLAPQYEKAAGLLLTNNPSVALAKVNQIDFNQWYSKILFLKVDCDVETEICSEYGIDRYPSMFLYVFDNFIMIYW